MTDHPTITIVMAVLDGADTIERCLDSIAAQDDPNVEVVVMDGCSTDGTVAILEKRSDVITFWESSPDRSITHAWNKALKHVTGDWVYFIGADDWLSANDVLSTLAGHLGAVEADDLVVYGQVAHVDEAGKVMQYIGTPWPGLNGLRIHQTPVPHPATFQRRVAFETYGEFDESLRIAADLEFLTRTFRDRAPRFLPNFVVANHQRGGLAEEPGNALLALRECWRVHRMHGLRLLPLVWPICKAAMKKMLVSMFGSAKSKKIVDVVRALSGRKSIWK